MSSQRYELEDGFRGMLCLSDMSSKTASSKDAGRFRSQKSTKDVCAACLIARALSETTILLVVVRVVVVVVVVGGGGSSSSRGGSRR